MLSTENIERIEIVCGPLSAVYGSDTLGGVIYIITRPEERVSNGRRLQLGESWHSNENPVRFWHSLLRTPKEAASDAMPNRHHTR
jgi:outer membrane receptor for Fe3+-dicitrate